MEVQEKNKTMNLIIPMAGKGTRLRPQTLATPKPLIEIAGKTIIQRILEIVLKGDKKIQKIAFVIEHPDNNIEEVLRLIAQKNNIQPYIFYQHQPKGTAHAIYCAEKILKGPTLIIFADTLFEADLSFSTEYEASICVHEVKNPNAYGVVKINQEGYITDFIEKPTTNISNLAIVGIYYFNRGEILAKELKIVLNNNIIVNGEYQITSALENLKNKIYSGKQLIDLSKDCDAILSSINDKIDEKIINKLSDKVKIISNFAVGFCSTDVFDSGV